MISVIVPFYKGNKYLASLKQSLERACTQYEGAVEVILVNDSPEEKINEQLMQSSKYNLILVKHKKNYGIHQARVTGIENATGEYILFLDQDDKIKKDFFLEMISAFTKDSSIAFAFANGIFEDENGRTKLILNSYGKVYGAEKYSTYLKVGNLLASPGQCLIKKTEIPKAWMEHIMQSNCADDFLLWILILKDHKAKYINKVLYEHITTGENASGSRLNGYKSDLEVCEILQNINLLSPAELKRFSKRCISNYKREKGDNYNYFEWLYSQQVEIFERLKMKIIGKLYLLIGEKILN